MKLAICRPTAGAPKWQHVGDLIKHVCTAARVLGWDYINDFPEPGLLPMTREACLLKALRWGADRILWVDDDMTVEPNPAFGNIAPLAGLMQVMDDNEKCGVVGAIYRKQFPALLTVTVPHPTLWTKSRGPAGAIIVRDIPTVPFKAMAVGGGYMLMRVSAAQDLIEKAGAPLWRTPLLEMDGRPDQYMNEDVDMCLKMREHGWEVWADPRPITTHFKDAGPLVYEHGTWERTPSDLRPFTKETSALFRDASTGVVALDIYTPKETRSKPGYEFMEMTLGAPR